MNEPINPEGEQAQTHAKQNQGDANPPNEVPPTNPEIQNPDAARSKTASQEKLEPRSTSDIVIARWTRVLGVSTILLFLATAGTGYVLLHTDNEIGRQITLMENDQRPWVRPKFVRFSDMTITDDKLSFGVNIQFENIGKTPAFNVRGYQGLFNGDGNLLPQHDAWCQQIETGAVAWKNPVVIFPNETTPEVLNPLEGKIIDLQLGLSPNQPSDTPRVLSPEILGCVVYESAAGTTYHHTWYSWGIVRQDQNGKIRRIESIAQTIPGREIGRGWMNSGRNYAD
jgi:hypothetical protein